MKRRICLGVVLMLAVLLLLGSGALARTYGVGDAELKYVGNNTLYIMPDFNNAAMKDYVRSDNRAWYNETNGGWYQVELSFSNGNSCSRIGNYVFFDMNYIVSVNFCEGYLKGPVGDYAFAECDRLDEVNLGPNVTDIESYAFYKDHKLKEFYADEDMSDHYTEGVGYDKAEVAVTSIGDYAFWDCDSLIIASPKWTKLKSIGTYAFHSCESITNIDALMQNKLKTIGKSAFSSCTGLTGFTTPASLETLGAGCCTNCDKLSTVDLSHSTKLKALGETTFTNCTSLTKITLPTSVQSIGNRCFENCKSLTSITLPASVQTIGENAFLGTNITTVYYNGTDKSSIAIASGNDVLKNAKWICTLKSENYKIEANSTEVDVGDTVGLSVSMSDTDETTNDANLLAGRTIVPVSLFNWSISSTARAKLSDGKITFLKAGDVTVTASLKTDPTKSASVTFHVSDVELEKLGIKAAKRVVKLSNGKKIKLTATFKPKNTSQTGVKWTSSDKKIATVNNKGLVTFKKAGTVTITCVSKANEEIKATIKLRAK